jgi:peptidoglycan-associated lipoprotein
MKTDNKEIGKMKRILVALMVIAMVSGCSFTKKKTDGEGGVTSETTATGGKENVQTEMNFSVQGSDSGAIEGLQTIRFEYDKATLTPEEQKKLAGNADWMKNNSGVKMVIEGHCDQRGSTEYNLSLGERRAITVKQMLQNLGVAGDRLTTTSFGKEKLIANGDSEEEMTQNRRANFVPTKK